MGCIGGSMSKRTERGSIFEVAGIPKSRWKAAVRESMSYARRYVVGLDGLVYPSSVAVRRGVDGYPVSSDRVALGMARLIRAGRVRDAERRWLHHLRQSGGDLWDE
jgi:hypothetical protein